MRVDRKKGKLYSYEKSNCFIFESNMQNLYKLHDFVKELNFYLKIPRFATAVIKVNFEHIVHIMCTLCTSFMCT